MKTSFLIMHIMAAFYFYLVNWFKKICFYSLVDAVLGAFV